jgi:hypothetical protein
VLVVEPAVAVAQVVTAVVLQCTVEEAQVAVAVMVLTLVELAVQAVLVHLGQCSLLLFSKL